MKFCFKTIYLQCNISKLYLQCKISNQSTYRARFQGLRQDVIADLVDQCRSYKQRVVQLVNSTS
jgi:hypothetical protein